MGNRPSITREVPECVTRQLGYLEQAVLLQAFKRTATDNHIDVRTWTSTVLWQLRDMPLSLQVALFNAFDLTNSGEINEDEFVSTMSVLWIAWQMYQEKVHSSTSTLLTVTSVSSAMSPESSPLGDALYSILTDIYGGLSNVNTLYRFKVRPLVVTALEIHRDAADDEPAVMNGDVGSVEEYLDSMFGGSLASSMTKGDMVKWMRCHADSSCVTWIYRIIPRMLPALSDIRHVAGVASECLVSSEKDGILLKITNDMGLSLDYTTRIINSYTTHCAPLRQWRRDSAAVETLASQTGRLLLSSGQANSADTDGDRVYWSISCESFAETLLPSLIPSQAIMLAKAFDLNHNGLIDVLEFAECVSSILCLDIAWLKLHQDNFKDLFDVFVIESKKASKPSFDGLVRRSARRRQSSASPTIVLEACVTEDFLKSFASWLAVLISVQFGVVVSLPEGEGTLARYLFPTYFDPSLPLEVGSHWYLIPAEWWEQWCNYSSFTAHVPTPRVAVTPVSAEASAIKRRKNKKIVSKTASLAVDSRPDSPVPMVPSSADPPVASRADVKRPASLTTNALIDSTTSDGEYEIHRDIPCLAIPQRLWVFFQSAYDAGPQIQRTVIDSSGLDGNLKPMIEIHLKQLRVTVFTQDGALHVADRVIQVSQAISLHSLRQRIKEILWLQCQATCIRLWLRRCSRDSKASPAAVLSGLPPPAFELLYADDVEGSSMCSHDAGEMTVSEANLDPNDLVCVETQLGDGRWAYRNRLALSRKPSRRLSRSSSSMGGDVPVTPRDLGLVGGISSHRERSESSVSNASVVDSEAGLVNLGNTCYFNASLQCLARLPLLRDYFVYNRYTRDLNLTNKFGAQGKLAISFASLLHRLDQSCLPCNPRIFWNEFTHYKSAFQNDRQHDAHEFLNYLLEGLAEDLNRVKMKGYTEIRDSEGRPDAVVAAEWWAAHVAREYSIVSALFTGQLKSLLTCTTCEHMNAKFDAFNFLQVPVPAVRLRTLHVRIILPHSIVLGRDILESSPSQASCKSRPFLIAIRVEEDATAEVVIEELVRILQDCIIHPGHAGVPVSEIRAPSPRRLHRDGGGKRILSDQIILLSSRFSLAQPSVPRPMKANAKVFAVAADAKAGSGSIGSLKFINKTPITALIVQEMFDKGDSSSSLKRDDMREIRIVHRRATRESHYYSQVVPSGKCLFGVPSMLRCRNRSLSVSQLKRFVTLESSRWMRGFDLLGIDTFTLVEVKEDGLRCIRCPWIRGCMGCRLGISVSAKPLDSSAVDGEAIVDFSSSSVVVAVDWPADAVLRMYDEQEALLTLEDAHPSVRECELEENKPVTLHKCMSDFFVEESVEAYCSHCKSLEQHRKKFSLWRAPPILMIHLKRFKIQTTEGDAALPSGLPGLALGKKITTHVDFDLEGFHLAPYMTSLASDSAVADAAMLPTVEFGIGGKVVSCEEAVYDVHACVNHIGSLNSGHYFADVLDAGETDRWIDYNDERVNFVKPEAISSPGAYILFYVRRDIVDKPLTYFLPSRPLSPVEQIYTEDQLHTIAKVLVIWREYRRNMEPKAAIQKIEVAWRKYRRNQRKRSSFALPWSPPRLSRHDSSDTGEEESWFVTFPSELTDNFQDGQSLGLLVAVVALVYQLFKLDPALSFLIALLVLFIVKRIVNCISSVP